MENTADKTLKHSQDADGAETHLGHVSAAGVEHIEDLRWGECREEGTWSIFAASFTGFVDALVTPRRLRRRPHRGNADAALARA